MMNQFLKTLHSCFCLIYRYTILHSLCTKCENMTSRMGEHDPPAMLKSASGPKIMSIYK